MQAFLQADALIAADHPKTVAQAQACAGRGDERAQVVNIYYWVRDEIRYNPYSFTSNPEHLRADITLAAGEGWCVPKAILMAAMCRAVGIPTAVGFADVKNHLSTERLRAQMKTDVFYYHGYCSVYLDGQWVKATPAFNRELCEKFSLKTLEFDGHSDSLYHPFDLAGQRHMEYIHDHGTFAEVPVAEMYAKFDLVYGTMMGADASQWDADVASEAITSQ
jgi:transglutaminase-like putative cysteine protease